MRGPQEAIGSILVQKLSTNFMCWNHFSCINPCVYFIAAGPIWSDGEDVNWRIKGAAGYGWCVKGHNLDECKDLCESKKVCKAILHRKTPTNTQCCLLRVTEDEAPEAFVNSSYTFDYIYIVGSELFQFTHILFYKQLESEVRAQLLSMTNGSEGSKLLMSCLCLYYFYSIFDGKLINIFTKQSPSFILLSPGILRFGVDILGSRLKLCTMIL